MQSPNKGECTAQKSGAQHDQSGNELGIPASEGACLNTFAPATEEGEIGKWAALYDSMWSHETVVGHRPRFGIP